MDFATDFSTIPPQVEELAKRSVENSQIDPALYAKYNVKRGLRDRDGKGVLTGLTEISEVWGHQVIDGVDTEIDGILRYRGYDVEALIKGFPKNNNFSFEEVIYLLLFGELPTEEQFAEFKELLAGYRTLPIHFVRDIIMKAPSKDMMNTLARSVLTLYSYDQHSDDGSPENVLRQCLELIALFPQLSIYGYQTYHMLRMDSQFTPLEAKVLDMALVLHAEHGGGNNSTFTTHVVTSSGTDTYSSTAASLGSLKGPRHGGANIKVVKQMEELKSEVKDWQDDDEIAAYLNRLLNRDAFDKAGLIYGLGHAIYTKSDPRARMLKQFVRELSAEKGRTDEFELYERIERIGPGLITAKRNTQKSVCANVDFYSGFAYSMLGLPLELYTPIFAIARIAGWSAHRMEEIINKGKIIRPAYMSICPPREYKPFEDR